MVATKRRVNRGRRAMGMRTINWLKHSRQNQGELNATTSNNAVFAQQLTTNKTLARELNQVLEEDRELANEEEKLNMECSALLLQQKSSTFASSHQNANVTANVEVGNGEVESSSFASTESIQLNLDTVKHLRSQLIQIRTLTDSCLAMLDDQP